MALNIKNELEQFSVLKTENQTRNNEYYLLRQAAKGNFRWPRDWPNHIPKVKHNLCKPIAERFSTYLMGRGFTLNVDRPNTLEFREAAERTEKILRRLFQLSHADTALMTGAHTGSLLGRTIYRVYRKGKGKRQHACFQRCQPDYFYGIPSGEPGMSEYAKVFYSYPLDRSEAKRLFGDHPYKSEADLAQSDRYDPLPEEGKLGSANATISQRVPVVEIWTPEDYALVVGGVEIYNDENTNKWSDTREGFVPFVVMENIRHDGEDVGESDIGQVRELNEQYNYLLSRKQYVVGRWLQPTLVWEGAPQNYLEVLTSTVGGGGAIPTRLGSRLYFLAYDRPNPQVQELEQSLRTAILETAGLNEIAFQGTVHGYVNTGPSVNAQYQPLTSIIQKKQTVWGEGLRKLAAMLLQITEDIGDSEVLGITVVNASVSSKDGSDGEIVVLSGKDIAGLREVTVAWPGLLPKDDENAAQLELQKAQQGLQSYYTTLEKLGEEYPDDELARIRMENNDPSLKGAQVAEQMRAQGSMNQANAQAAKANADAAAAGGAPAVAPEGEEPTPEDTGVGARLRSLARGAGPKLDMTQDEPTIGGY